MPAHSPFFDRTPIHMTDEEWRKLDEHHNRKFLLFQQDNQRIRLEAAAAERAKTLAFKRHEAGLLRRHQQELGLAFALST